MDEEYVFVVHFSTESGDHYLAAFREEPTDEHLTAYIKERFPEEISEDGKCRYIFWDVEECVVENLPIPVKAIPSI